MALGCPERFSLLSRVNLVNRCMDSPPSSKAAGASCSLEVRQCRPAKGWARGVDSVGFVSWVGGFSGCWAMVPRGDGWVSDREDGEVEEGGRCDSDS